MMNILDKKSKNKTSRRVRRKFDDVAGLSITSLLDVLTIILVFLIKNVSMEAQKVTVPDNMLFPTTITNEKLIASAGTYVVKMYPDQIFLGTESLPFGALADIVTNADKRQKVFDYLKYEADIIWKQDKNNEPCLLIQADEQIPCQYVSEMVRIGTNATFQYIYFSTLEDATWFAKEAVAVKR